MAAGESTKGINKSAQVDLINIGLLLLSLVLAYQIPFALFLVAYAVLGPLHYLTEINWIRDKSFFVTQKHWLLMALLLCAGVVLPKFFTSDWQLGDLVGAQGRAIFQTINFYSNGYLLAAFVLALSLVLIKPLLWRIILTAAALLLGYLANEVPFYVLLIGLMLPTLIHVYLFTLLFMLYGALRSNSKAGYWSVGLALACLVFIIFYPVEGRSYMSHRGALQIYHDNEFYVMTAKVGQFLGLSPGTTFAYDGVLEIKIQIFISFAYLYHYLNWFSKTTVIGWHKRLTAPRTLLIASLWVGMVTCFWIDYRLGYLISLFFSFLHVILEFPLNVISIREIGLRLKRGLTRA